jgi:hypothetical protein
MLLVFLDGAAQPGISFLNRVDLLGIKGIVNNYREEDLRPQSSQRSGKKREDRPSLRPLRVLRGLCG